MTNDLFLADSYDSNNYAYTKGKKCRLQGVTALTLVLTVSKFLIVIQLAVMLVRGILMKH